MRPMIPAIQTRADSGENWLHCVELQRMYASFGDDEPFFVEMIRLFQQSSQQCLSKLEEAIKSHDSENIFLAATGFAGLVSVYSDTLALEMGEALLTLEAGGTEYARELLQRMRAITEDIMHDLAALHPAESNADERSSGRDNMRANWRHLARSASAFRHALSTL